MENVTSIMNKNTSDLLFLMQYLNKVKNKQKTKKIPKRSNIIGAKPMTSRLQAQNFN